MSILRKERSDWEENREYDCFVNSESDNYRNYNYHL